MPMISGYSVFPQAALLLSCMLFPSLLLSQVVPVGLQDRTINAIAAEQGDADGSWFSGTANLLFAAVQGEGVYQGWTWHDGGKWEFIGPPLDPPSDITTLGVQHWGYGPRDGLHLYAGFDWRPGSPPDSPLLLRREFYAFGSAPADWVRADSGLGKGEDRWSISALESFYFTGHTPPQPLLSWTDSGAVRSGPGGFFWEKTICPPSFVLDIDVTPHWFGDHAWAAGAEYQGTQLTNAAAFRSTDKGQTWKVIPFHEPDQSWATAVAVSPGHPDTAWISVMGDVYRTVDNGKHWRLVLNQDTKGIIALATDPLNPSHVYAAGSGEFTLLHSTDLGDSWHRIYPDVGYEPREISCMTVALMDTLPMSRLPRFGLFLGTRGTGVWVFDMLFGPTSVSAPAPLPGRERLTVYPNPAEGAVTIELQLKNTHSVVLEVADLLGRVVLRREFGMREAGWHGFHLPTGKLIPGSYLLRAVGIAAVAPRQLQITR
ncbi:MAG: hypothetical protein JXA28_10695 [Bacteroidetes bacterium]|nr:hypothetical protein [Bacteroidota bacterium]